MRIQHLAVIFIIIILPISMVIGEYIQSQIDTIYIQTQYSKLLQDATYDALRALQINTINNKYSSLSDSKIRDIEASVNTFYNSISTSLGKSKDFMTEYIPAMVYTMYDGYYIYGKYFNYDPSGESGVYQYGLKPFIYYACRYERGNDNFVVNYTLDNSLTVYGRIDGNYEVKSGYVIDPLMVTDIEYRGADSIIKGYVFPVKLRYDNLEIIEAEVMTEQLVSIDGDKCIPEDFETEDIPQFEYTKYQNQKIYRDGDRYFTCTNNRRIYLTDDGKILRDDEVTPLRYAQAMTWDDHLHNNSAVEYYYNAKEFSQWVKDKIGGVSQADAIDNNGWKVGVENKFKDKDGKVVTDSNGLELAYFAVDLDRNHKIFDFSSTNNPLVSGSPFNEHRMNVIRRSIETNLLSAIANYNAGTSGSYLFQMPVFSEDDWTKLVNNVSLSVFMQGLPMKSKLFNSYCIITNDKNEEVVTEDSIYIVAEDNNGRKEVHIPGCKNLLNSDYTLYNGYNVVDFQLQTVTITEGEERYYYPQLGTKSEHITYCYDCIVNTSDTYDIDGIIIGNLTENNRSVRGTDLRRIYLTALGRERYDLYRENASFIDFAVADDVEPTEQSTLPEPEVEEPVEEVNPNEITITFSSTTSTSGDMEVQKAISGEAYTLNSNQYVRDGWEFVGWTTYGSFTPIYTDGQQLTDEIKTNTTLFPLWKQDLDFTQTGTWRNVTIGRYTAKGNLRVFLANNTSSFSYDENAQKEQTLTYEYPGYPRLCIWDNTDNALAYVAGDEFWSRNGGLCNITVYRGPSGYSAVKR